ncbi:hypothetical protein [Cupriavidus plantarum]|uniref:hypothetical protein n=1 Tax=Cupriavidus plantarum TaxID=942865 RepID=UPI0011B1CC35|nr:hypothetical protein [Cupriavidus plantarum]
MAYKPSEAITWPFSLILLLVLSVVLACGCAMSVRSTPTEFVPDSRTGFDSELRMRRDVEIRLDTGYRRVISAGTRWKRVGRVSEGEVLKPVGTVFSIEGRHVHEAYLVIEDGLLRGFYLPAERAYSPLSSPIQLSGAIR